MGKNENFLSFFTPDFDECHNNLCQNGGTCVNTYGDYRCECKHGYSGKNCHLGEYNCFVI